ncbi:MAG: hypothetical protein QXK47_06510, partial [Candidatus Bathyarchaeia archaeon]
MDKKLSKTLTLPMTLILLLGMMAALPVSASPGTVIYLDPSSINITTSTLPNVDPLHGFPYGRFNVTFKVSDVSDLAAWQGRIWFNHSIINVTRWFEPTWNSQYVFYLKSTMAAPSEAPHPQGGYYVTTYTSVSPTSAYITVGSNRFPAPPPGGGFYGSGILAIVEFNITSLPSKYEVFTDLLDIDVGETYLLDSIGGGIPVDAKIGCTYRLEWTQPPAPTFWVGPSVTLDQYPPSKNGTQVSMNVVLNIDPAWGATAAFCRLIFNYTVITTEDANVTLNFPGTVTVVGDDDGVFDDTIDISVTFPTSPGGAVTIATIKFIVAWRQGTVPPLPSGYFEISPVEFDPANCGVEDHVGPIAIGGYTNAFVKVFAMVVLPYPWFVVDPVSTTFGPEPSVGKTFKIKIKILGLSRYWYCVGYQFRLWFDAELLEVVEAVEGPFWKNTKWNKYGTFFIAMPDTGVLAVGGLLYPNAMGQYDQTVFPDSALADPTVALITLKAIKQVYPETLTSPLDLTGLSEWLIDKNGQYIGVDESKVVNGTYTITSTPLPGRVIDLVGGLEGVIFEAPYGGQGPNQPMDLVWPQKLVTLEATVTYNYWPVQSKDVAFEIEGPLGGIFTIESPTMTVRNGCLIWGVPGIFPMYIDLTNPAGIYTDYQWVPGTLWKGGMGGGKEGEGYWLIDWIDTDASGDLSVGDSIWLLYAGDALDDWPPYDVGWWIVVSLDWLPVNRQWEMTLKMDLSAPVDPEGAGIIEHTWHEVWPKQCVPYHIIDWIDNDQSGDLSYCDDIVLEHLGTLESATYHVEAVVWTGTSWQVTVKNPDTQGQIWAKLTARTDENGVARVSFRMPWPCEDPESLFGVWRITATVDVACVVIVDTMLFHYDYLVEMFKVTTDKYSYHHGETITVAIECGTHAQQFYPALFVATLVDELGVPVAIAMLATDVGGAQFCSFNPFVIRLTLCIPKYAFTGY